jgi:hypothetical protein
MPDYALYSQIIAIKGIVLFFLAFSAGFFLCGLYIWKQVNKKNKSQD